MGRMTPGKGKLHLGTQGPVQRRFKEIVKASSLEAALQSLLEEGTSQFQSIHSASSRQNG